MPSRKYFVKLSLDVDLGGVVRTIPEGEVARSVGTMRYLEQMKKALDPRFVIVPEVLGISPKDWARGGQIIRLIPKSVETDQRRLVPLFSLYSRPQGGQSLLEEFSKKSGMSPFEFFRQKILIPFQEAWVNWAVVGSTVMEAHAQNVLMEFDRNDIPTGKLFHRDLGGFNIDTRSPSFDRKNAKLLTTFKDLNSDYHQKSSIEAVLQSQLTYFEGGFLYNIDRELQRIDPTYQPGSVIELSRSLRDSELARLSGGLAKGGLSDQLRQARKTVSGLWGLPVPKTSKNQRTCLRAWFQGITHASELTR